MQNLAIASNRSENALDIYRMDEGQVSFVTRTLLVDDKGVSLEPYGLCLTPGLDRSVNIFLPTKSGVLYHYVLDAHYQSHLHAALDLARLVTLEEDDFIKYIVSKAATAEGRLPSTQSFSASRKSAKNTAVSSVIESFPISFLRTIPTNIPMEF